ncbi:16269_t:CDS:10 [Rhizophagus irregularis]|nr:16269_t:CDS:10 [Rhizophagus irregularis]
MAMIVLLFILLLQYLLIAYSFEINVHYAEGNPELQAFRIEPYIDANGTIKPIDMSLPIPDFNFNNCKYFNKSDENVEYDIGVERQPGTRVYSITPGYLLVTYLNTTDVTASPAVFGLIINWQELGFFVSEFITGSYNIKWRFFSQPDERGQITLSNENIITFTQIKSETRFIEFPTIGYGYCVITFGSTSSFRSPVDPPIMVSETALIYQNTNNPPLKIDDITCGNSFIIVGYSCFIAVSDVSINGGRYVVQVDFSSTGSVTDIKEIRGLNITKVDHIFMSILFNGGYLLTIHTRMNEGNDDVLVVALKQVGTSDIWNIYYSELPRFIEELSSGNISIFEVNGKESYFRQSFNGQTTEFLTSDSYGSVKLDIKSSKSFLNLQSEQEKKKIRDNLAIELSESASVSPDRIKVTERYQNDQGQVVLLFSISATDDPFKSSANTIMKDLNTLIKFKSY